MQTRWGSYRLTVVCGWLLLALTAYFYAGYKKIALPLAVPVAAAFLLEFPFYILPGFDGPREFLGTWKKEYVAVFMTVTAVVPYLVCALATGTFTAPSLLILLAIAGTISFWYLLWPPSPVADLAFLAILAAIIIEKVFDLLYISPIPKVPISYLGHIMVIRTGAMAVLLIRGRVSAGFRFLPNRREWLTGLTYFGALLPFAGAAYFLLGLAELRQPPQNPAIAAGTFFGILWVVALSEEFFFRGLLQNWLTGWTRNRLAALVITSVLFGCVHLGFRFHSEFPNWRFAIVAGVAGLFYGLAARKAGSVQASMVTHALTVTVWRVFLR